MTGFGPGMLVGLVLGLLVGLIVVGGLDKHDRADCAASCKPATFSKLDVQRGCICGVEVKK